MASAEKTTPAGGMSSTNAQTAAVANAVVHEAPVIATGARPGQQAGKRELFKETTTTALVFPNGGVIRLPFAVGAGQLLFLSNQQTRKEVVAQVTRRRENPQAGYYVELEFTEPTPDFWGVKFTAETHEVAAKQAPAAAAEFLKPSEPSTEEGESSPPAPTADEIHALMEQVEALRAQLKSMQTPAPTAQSQTPTAAITNAAAGAPPVPQLANVLSSILAPAAENANAKAAGAEVAKAAVTERAKETVAQEQKEELAAEEHEAVVAVAPKRAAVRPAMAAAVVPRETRSERSNALMLGVLTAASLFAVFAAAWNMHWLPWNSGGTTTMYRSAAPAKASVPPNAAAKKPAIPPLAANNAARNATTPGLALDPAAEKATEKTRAENDAAAYAGGSKASNESSARLDAEPRRERRSEATPLQAASRRAVHHAATTDAGDSLEPDENGFVPPRLIKSVRAVAPAQALRDFMTGNVTLDALIDETGHVRTMKVLSGPESFHKAAMEALREYKYAPAEKNGKPVAAHIKVMVPFWFEP